MTDDVQPPIDEDEAIAVVIEAVEVAYVEGFVDGLSDEPPPEARTRTAADSAKQFEVITNHLERSITLQKRVAALLSVAALGFTCYAFLKLLPDGAATGLKAITDAAVTPDGKEVANPGLAPLVTVYEIIRTTGYAALLGGLVYGMFNMARAALDQATRFDKRLVAARFLDYAIHTDNASKEQMEHALKVLEAWGANVESAYTHVKVRGKTTEPMSFSIGKDGVSMQNGQTSK